MLLGLYRACGMAWTGIHIWAQGVRAVVSVLRIMGDGRVKMCIHRSPGRARPG